MASIDDAIALFTKFFEAEAKVIEANLAGASTFTRRHAKMTKMLAEPHVHVINRHEPATVKNAKGLAKAGFANTLKELAPRRIYLVEQYDAGKKKKIFCAYVSTARKPALHTMYDEKFFADDSLHIIGTQWSCADCHGSGMLQGKACRDCRGRGWHRHSGDGLFELGEPTAFKKLLRPTWPECAQHYDSL